MKMRMMCACLVVILMSGLAASPGRASAVADERQEAVTENYPCLDICCAGFCEALCRIVQTVASNEAPDDGIETEQIEVMPAEDEEPAQAEVLDFMPREVDHRHHRASNASAPVENAEQLRQVRHLYKIAGRCCQNGDMDMARNCYEEIVRICPDCRHGRLAQNWLARLKDGRENSQQQFGVEEQEPGTESDRDLLEHLRLRAEQLRRQSQEPPVCPFHKDGRAGEPSTPSSATFVKEARALYRQGQHFQRSGDLAQAYRCYQDVVSLAPESSWAEKAAKCMEQIDALTEDETTEDESMSAEEMQELLNATELLDVNLDEDVRVLTVDAPARDLVAEEESEPAAADIESLRHTLLELSRTRFAGKKVEFMTDGWGNEATFTVDGVSYVFVRNKLGILELCPPPAE
jgi:hypothetical protein